MAQIDLVEWLRNLDSFPFSLYLFSETYITMAALAVYLGHHCELLERQENWAVCLSARLPACLSDYPEINDYTVSTPAVPSENTPFS